MGEGELPEGDEDAMMMDAIVEAIENREPQAVAELDGETRPRDLSSLRYDLDLPPEEQFRHLSTPTLVPRHPGGTANPDISSVGRSDIRSRAETT